MATLPDTFCVFILTHGRPDNVITLKTLEKCGYTGRLYLVVDNEDKTIDRYRQNFGSERVIVFDKQAEADACDEGNNFDEHRTILMARNACFKISEQLGVTHFIELDDDYTAFDYRVIVDGVGLVKPIKHIDNVLLRLIGIYESSNAYSIAFAQGGDFIGAIDNGKASYRFSRRKCMNSFVCSTRRPFKFIGAMNEDVNTYTTLGNRGALFLTIPVISLTQKTTQSQTGGITGMYQRFGTYCKAFTTVMMLPSAVKVSMMQSNNPRIHHAISWKQAVPCIISEKYRKEKTIALVKLNEQHRLKVATPRHPYDPVEHPAPPVPSAAVIGGLADLVMAGQIVSASLNDGTYVALMQELNQRGYELTDRTEIEKQAAPWTFRVAPVASIPIEAL